MPMIKGKVRSLNLSPAGFCESFLMDDGKRIVQINFDRDSGEHVSNGLKPGKAVSVNAKPYGDDRPSDHPVFSWIDQKKASYEGVVKQINYALHGEPNGAILKTGEFVHLRPDGARAIRLTVGHTLLVEGEVMTVPGGQIVIEAKIANGLALKGNGKKGHKGKKHAA